MQKRKAVLSLFLAAALLVCTCMGCADPGNTEVPSAPPVSEEPVPTAAETLEPAITDPPEDTDAPDPEETDEPEPVETEEPEPTPSEDAEPTASQLPGPLIAVIPGPIAPEIPTEGPLYQKIHFTLGDSIHGTIIDWEDLNLAIQDLRTYAAEQGFQQSFQITVEFQSDYLNTEQYLSLAQERESLETEEEIQDWQARSEAWSREYHSNLVAENLGTLAALHYNLATPVEFSPNVLLDIDIQSITADALAYVAFRDVIVSLSVSSAESAAPVAE